MSYASLPTDVRETAERILTRKQLDVFKLRCQNPPVAFNRIANMLDISEPRARAIEKRVHQKIKIEMDKEAA